MRLKAKSLGVRFFWRSALLWVVVIGCYGCGSSLDERLLGTWQNTKNPRETYVILEDGRMFKHTKQSADPSLTEVLIEDIEYSYEVVDENTIEMEPQLTCLTFWVCLVRSCTILVDYEFTSDNYVYLVRGGERTLYRRLAS